MYVNNFIKKLLNADYRTLIKAGFMNNDLTLTDRGRGGIMAILVTDDKIRTDLVELANEAIADEDCGNKE